MEKRVPDDARDACLAAPYHAPDARAAKANPRRACTSSYTLQPRAFVTSLRVSSSSRVSMPTLNSNKLGHASRMILYSDLRCSTFLLALQILKAAALFQRRLLFVRLCSSAPSLHASQVPEEEPNDPFLSTLQFHPHSPGLVHSFSGSFKIIGS